MKIIVVTDLCVNHVDGVNTTWSQVVVQLQKLGHKVLFVRVDDQFSDMKLRSLKLFGEPDLYQVASFRKLLGRLKSLLTDFKPNHIHIATEGPVGLAAWLLCLWYGWHFTSSFHTMWPDYFEQRSGKLSLLPIKWLSWTLLRLFHNQAKAILVPTEDVKRQLEAHSFKNAHVWSRGVDTKAFSPDDPFDYEAAGYKRPILLSVGRVADEKGLKRLCEMDNVSGTKVIIGKGPALAKLQRQYPGVIFIGEVADRRLLGRYMAGANVFTFTSDTDTFGLVTIEAMASGTPVAALSKAAGMSQLITNGVNGFVADDLSTAVHECLRMGKPKIIRTSVQDRGWRRPTEELLSLLVPVS